MFHIKSRKLKLLFIVLSLESIKCSIDGQYTENRVSRAKPGEDPCNPQYWYPKNIPEYCNFKKMSIPPTDPVPENGIPMPIPVPVPAPLPMLPPVIAPPHEMPSDPSPPIMVPQPIVPLPISLPFGIPLAPTNPMVPVAGIPMSPQPAYPMSSAPQYRPPYQPRYPPPYPPPYPQPYPPSYGSPYPSSLPSPYSSLYPSPYPIPPVRGIGMVPGIPGLVSPDGGVNIMPFSDAYSDMLENHKQKMLRRRLQHFLDEYGRPPWKSRRKTRPKKGHDIE